MPSLFELLLPKDAERAGLKNDVQALQQFLQNQQLAQSPFGQSTQLPPGQAGPQITAQLPRAQSRGGAELFSNLLLNQQTQQAGLSQALQLQRPTNLQTQNSGEDLLVFNPQTGGFTETGRPSSRVPSTTINLPSPASPSERDAIATSRASEDALNNLRGLFESDAVGPLAGRVSAVKDIFGLNKPKISAFNAATKAFENQIIKEITGAQMSEQEASRILAQVPGIKDPPSVWVAKWAESKKNLERIRIRRLEVLAQSGLRVPGGKKVPTKKQDLTTLTDEQFEAELKKAGIK